MTLQELMDEVKDLVGKKVQDSTGGYWGTFWGVSEDEYEYYYVVQRDDKEVRLLSAVTGLSPYEG